MRLGAGTSVLTHDVPSIPTSGDDEWRALAAAHFPGVSLGADLHRIDIDAPLDPTTTTGSP